MTKNQDIEGIKTAVILGAGNVAWHLAHAMNKSGVKIRQIFNRTPDNGMSLAKSLDTQFIDSPGQIDRTSDLFVLAVSDDGISKVADSVEFLKTGILVHTSGSVPMQVLSRNAASYGVIYPLQTFTKGKAVNFNNVPVLVEGCDVEVYEKLFQMSGRFSEHVFRLSSHERFIIHCAAVISSNFSNYLLLQAESILRENGLSFDLLKPLMIETVSKAFEIGPLNAQTGPAKRGNKKVMYEHLKILESRPELRKIYKMLSQGILRHNWNDPDKI